MYRTESEHRLYRLSPSDRLLGRSSFWPYGVDLSAVVEAVTDAYGLDAEEAGHHLVADIAPHVFINGDEELLTQALANLVENALRHTPGGTRLDVRLVADPAAVRLVVEDNGPGVSPQDLQRLTRRFYRAERSRTAPGNGLGLSLVSAVAELTAQRSLLKPAPGDFELPSRSRYSGYYCRTKFPSKVLGCMIEVIPNALHLASSRFQPRPVVQYARYALSTPAFGNGSKTAGRRARARPRPHIPAPKYRCLIPAGQFKATSVRLRGPSRWH